MRSSISRSSTGDKNSSAHTPASRRQTAGAEPDPAGPAVDHRGSPPSSPKGHGRQSRGRPPGGRRQQEIAGQGHHAPQAEHRQGQQHAVHAEGRREAAHGKGQKKAVSRRHTGQQHHPDGGEPQQKCKQRIAEIDHQGRQSRLDSGRSLAPQADVVLQIPPQLVPRGVRHPARQDLSQKDAGQEEQRQQKQAGQRGQLDRGPLRQCSRVQSASPHRILCGGRRIYVAVDVRPCLF